MKTLTISKLAISSLMVTTITFSAITFYSTQSCAGTCGGQGVAGVDMSENVSVQIQHETLADLSSDQSAMLMPLGVSGSVL